MKKIKILEAATMLTVLILCGLVYVHHHPHHVQFGDAGELISRAYLSAVPHPPGYPLFTWIMKILVSHAAPGSVFSIASLANVVFSLACLTLIGIFCWGRQLWLPLLVTLAFSNTYFRYTEIPDVFILNALIGSAIIFCYLRLFRQPEKNSKLAYSIILLFSLGMANHLTIIFLMPLLFHVIWVNRKTSRTWMALALSGLIFAVLYLSLLLLDTQSPLSWGHLTTLGDVLRHFLRSDFGTFKLNAQPEKSQFVGITTLFLKIFISDFLPVALLALGCLLVAIVRRRRPYFHWWILLSCLVLYVGIFFSLSNIIPVTYGAEVLGRFFIFPHIMILFLVADHFYSLDFSVGPVMRASALAALTFLGLFNFFKYLPTNDFSKNTVIEDYAINLLDTGQKTPAIALVEGDTTTFASQYVQSVLGKNTGVTLIAQNMIFYKWYTEKLVRDESTIIIDGERLNRTRVADLEKDIILPNIDRFTFLVQKSFNEPEKYKVTFKKLGRLLQKGSGTSYDNPSLLRDPLRTDASAILGAPEKYNVFRDSLSEYTYFYLAKGLSYGSLNRLPEARESFKAALAVAPFCYRCLQNLCSVEAKLKVSDPNCANLESTRERLFPYF